MYAFQLLESKMYQDKNSSKILYIFPNTSIMIRYKIYHHIREEKDYYVTIDNMISHPGILTGMRFKEYIIVKEENLND